MASEPGRGKSWSLQVASNQIFCPSILNTSPETTLCWDRPGLRKERGDRLGWGNAETSLKPRRHLPPPPCAPRELERLRQTSRPGLRSEARGGRRAAAHLLPASAPSRCGPWSLPWARRSPARSSRSRKTSLRWRCRCRGRRSGPRRFRVLPRQNASPTPRPGASPHVPANLRCFSRHGPAPLGRPDNPWTTLACGIAPHRRHRGEAAATGHSRPAAPHAPPRNLPGGRNAAAALPAGRCFSGGPYCARTAGGRWQRGRRCRPAPPLPTPFPPPSLPSSSRSLPFSLPALALGSRREPCTAAGRRRSGGGSGDGGAGRAAAGAAPVPLGPGGGAGRGGRVLRHRHGRRRALVLAPGHGRGKRQLRDAAQLDRHDPLQLLQRHVRGPRVRPAGVDAGKRCLATASSRGLAGDRGQPWGRAGRPAVTTVEIAYLSMPSFLLCPPRSLHALKLLLPPYLVPKSFLCPSRLCSCSFQSFQ